jgi:predicted site-specific integrase-resolvase
MEQYFTPKESSARLKVCQQTLKKWDSDKLIETIRTPGGKRMYNVEKYLIDNGIKKEIIKRKICYCRVSSKSQESDLKNQKRMLIKLYPNHELIEDIGSGLNFKRKGFNKIIEYAINNEIEEVVVVYKDRLCRFGYEMVEMLIKTYSNGKIIIINNCSESPQEELTKDLVSIINVFSAKLNGMRSYKKDPII